jgi:hypothetical protein
MHQGKIIMKFRDTLQSALDRGIVTLDSRIEYSYEEIKVYRGITRSDKVRSNLNENDFLSQMEKPKKARGKKVDEQDLGSYSCSVFTDTKDLEQALFFPRPTKFIAGSEISSNENYFGPIRKNETTHIDLWLEKNAKPWEIFQYI